MRWTVWLLFGTFFQCFFSYSLPHHLIEKKIKWLPYFLIIWASTVAYSRVYLGMHFPGDIIVGAVMGILLGSFFAILALKVVKKSETKE
jgi:undecaprenyl-diphosphatase